MAKWRNFSRGKKRTKETLENRLPSVGITRVLFTPLSNRQFVSKMKTLKLSSRWALIEGPEGKGLVVRIKKPRAAIEWRGGWRKKEIAGKTKVICFSFWGEGERGDVASKNVWVSEGNRGLDKSVKKVRAAEWKRSGGGIFVLYC